MSKEVIPDTTNFSENEVDSMAQNEWLMVKTILYYSTIVK